VLPGLAQVEILEKPAHTPGYLENMVIAIEIAGVLDTGTLLMAFQDLCARQASLRFRFSRNRDGEFRRTIEPAVEVSGEVIDLSAYDEAEIDTEISRRIRRINFTPLDLLGRSLFSYSVLKAGPTRHICVVVLHHIVGDGWSRYILISELAELYTARVQGRLPNLTPLTTQYEHYIDWHREKYESGAFDPQREYWKSTLAQLPPRLDYPGRIQRPPVFTFNGAARPFSLVALTRSIKKFCRHRKISEYHLLLAAFFLLVYRKTGKNDIYIRSPIANRDYPELESVIGYFVHGVIVRVNVDNDLSGGQLIDAVAREALNAYLHHNLPAQSLGECCTPRLSAEIGSRFQLSFNHHNYPRQRINFDNCSAAQWNVPVNGAKTDLQVNTWLSPSGFMGSVVYYADAYSREDIIELVQEYRILLARLIEQSELGCAALCSIK
jgi:hypothetical protein